ncbi:MAG TPA: 2'-5' RNA ligase family protein [Chloroflexia bacterium]|nr:2'-5' RNA ligase family protein [Chloroflexia bacterium]
MQDDPGRLVVVGYPELPASQLDWIAGIRRRYPALRYSVVAPHFTLVFPLAGADAAPVVAHLTTRLAGQPAIPFVVRSSMLTHDATSPDTYVLLVPDAGFSGIVKLHDRLYTGLLAPHLRLDIPFIPHITVGYAGEAALCKQIVDAINGQAIELHGTLTRLMLLNVAGAAVETLAHFDLTGPDPTQGVA